MKSYQAGHGEHKYIVFKVWKKLENGEKIKNVKNHVRHSFMIHEKKLQLHNSFDMKKNIFTN